MSQQKGAGQLGDRAVNSTCRSEGAKPFSLPLARAAMLGQLWPIVIARQHDIGKALIITKQNIETRHHRLDEIRFKQECFNFCPCGDDLHRSGFSHHPHQPCASALTRV